MTRQDRIITAQVADDARKGDLYRRAVEIQQIAAVAIDCTRFGRTFDLDRAERKMAEIGRLARGEAA